MRERGRMASEFVHAALLQSPQDHKVRCDVCARRCLLGAGASGWCRARRNRHGRLETLTYGAVSSLGADPIEKKPFYHFHPGTLVFTAGSWSCNFGCPWCQNWRIAHAAPPFSGAYIAPDRFVHMAENAECQGVAVSYNEPVLSLEWSLDVFRHAQARGLYCAYVTNGYLTPEALALLADGGLDALNVDIKGDDAVLWKHGKGVAAERIWEICGLIRARGLHLELTTLVIPTVNDAPEVLRAIAERIGRELGAQTPWHVSGYYPAYRFGAPPTPVESLEQAWQIGQAAGLQHVYVGNVPGHRADNTRCPRCRRVLIRRAGYVIEENRVSEGHCPACGAEIPGVW